MIVFLLLSVPFWLLFLNSFFFNEGVRKRDYFIPLGKGAILYIGALLLTWLFTDRLALGRVTPLRLFIYNFKFYNGLTVSLWLILYVLSQLIGKGIEKAYRLRELFFLLGALFWADSLYRAVISESWYGLYEYFFLPLGNLGQIVILALLLVRFDSASNPGKILYLLLSFFVVFCYNVVPTLFSFSMPLAAVLTGTIFFAGTLFLLREELQGGLPGAVIRYRKDD